MKERIRLQALAALFLLSHTLLWSAPFDARPPAAAEDKDSRLQQPACQLVFESQVLGFLAGSMFVAAPDHLLRVEFAGAHMEPPQGPNGSSVAGKPPAEPESANEVVYPELWDGISLTYGMDASGNPKSTYRLQPGVSPAGIRLRYNRPARISPAGELVVTFPGGEVRESAPVAWQEIGGLRVPVHAEFMLLGEQLAGFRLRQYDSRYAVTIDPAVTWHTFLGSSSDEQGRGVALDSQGNVYIVGDGKADWTLGGALRGFSGGSDAFVAKLNSSGVRLWHTFLGSSADDFGYAITVDRSGNVIVAGNSGAAWGSPIISGYTGSSDAFVAKMDGNGTILWIAFLGSAEIDNASAVAADSSGNIFVGGTSDAGWGPSAPAHSGGTDAFLAKLSSSGGLSWNAFMGSSASDGMSGSMGVDSSDNVYVAGNSSSSWGAPKAPFGPGSSHAFIAKFNNAGTRLWHTFLGGSVSDVANGLVSDPEGNLFVAGSSNGSWGTPLSAYAGDSDIFVARLDSAGNLIWNTFMGSISYDAGLAIARDPSSGMIAVAGGSSSAWGLPLNAFSGGSRDVLVAALNKDGHRMWNTFLGDTFTEDAYGLAVDASRNVFLCGYSNTAWPAIGSPPVIGHTTGTSKDVFAARLPPVPASGVWNTFMGSSNDKDSASAAAADNSGNVLVVGQSSSSWGQTPLQPFGGGASDGLLTKLGPGGARLWHTFIGSTGADSANAVALDSSGDIFVAGTSSISWGNNPANGHSGGMDVFVARYSANGQLLWNTFLGSPVDDDSYALALDGSGRLYVAGFSRAGWGAPTNPYTGGVEAFLACINAATGQFLWHTFMGSAGGDDYAYGLAVKSGTAYVAGYSNLAWGSPVNPFNNSNDAFVAAFNTTTMQRTWLTFLGSAADDTASSLALDVSGNVVVAGTTNASWGTKITRPFSGSRDAFVAQLNSAGTLLWNAFLGSAADENGSSVITGPGGAVLVSGYGSGSWGTPLTPYTGQQDGFLARLDVYGNLSWNLFFGSSNEDVLFSMAMDRWGFVYLPGFSTSSWGNPVYNFVGVQDALVVKVFYQDLLISSYLPLIHKN